MNLQLLPRSLMIFGALLTVLGGLLYLLDKHFRRNSLTHFYEKTWSLYLIIVVILIVSILLTIAINGIWHPLE